MPYFISEFKKKNKDTFFAKFKISETDATEHIWLMMLRIDNDRSYGIISNEPAGLKHIIYGDTLTINIWHAEDIMIIRNDSIYFGGFLQKEMEK
ncbi:DUF2314 domain-containing protein [Flavobacterium rhizosphaerae]|uniref:DUF2314 domain-containing protein n=1 Tax=Flavobacterium rhizosphaerae TaxID=3163298 RepID=A0ABW8YWU3_9FLAO